MSAKKKVTIKDIAVLLHVSPHTVSKALNGKPGVSEKLRQEIKEKARELNYVPNIFGKGLSGKTAKTIGIINPNDVNPAYSIILNGLSDKAAEAEYDIILCNSREDVRREEKLIRMLLEKRVEGIIISPVAHSGTAKNIELLRQFELPYVLLARSIEPPIHPCVKAQNFAGGYLVGQYLLEKGHSEILYVTRRQPIASAEERIQGLRQAFLDHDRSFSEENVYCSCDINIESGYREMLKILQERRDFSAVFAYNDIIAYGVMKAVHECRLRIPNDIAIIGFDNLMFSEICLVPLTTVNQDLSAMGTIAIERLLNQIAGKGTVSSSEMPVPYIVERQSV